MNECVHFSLRRNIPDYGERKSFIESTLRNPS